MIRPIMSSSCVLKFTPKSFITGSTVRFPLNGNMSATETTYDPWAVFNYDGNRIFKQLKDFFGSATGTWQSLTSYSVGQWVVYNGYTQVVTTAGTSGSHTPMFSSSPGYPTIDGSVGWTNAGNTTYWRNCSYNVGMQY